MRDADVIGAQVRHLRGQAGITTGQLARAGRQIGMAEWTDGRISAIERGAWAPTPGLLYALALAFGRATGRAYRLADLLPDAGDAVEVGQALAVSVSDLRSAMSGEPVVPPALPDEDPDDATLLPGWGAADDTAVSRLGLDPWLVRALAVQLWGAGATLTAERDRRAGENPTKQRLGSITRRLLEEVAAAAEAASSKRTGCVRSSQQTS